MHVVIKLSATKELYCAEAVGYQFALYTTSLTDYTKYLPALEITSPKTAICTLKLRDKAITQR